MGPSHTEIAYLSMLMSLLVTARQIQGGCGPPAVALWLDSRETALLQKLMTGGFRWESWLQSLT